MKVTQNVDLDQLWINYNKAYRANVRLKHALRADNEINATIVKVRRAFEKQIQQGILPAPPVFELNAGLPEAGE